MKQLDAEQTASVLEQIAGHSSDDNIREDVRQVAAALRGSGFILIDGPPQEALRRGSPGDPAFDRRFWGEHYGQPGEPGDKQARLAELEEE